MAALSAASCEGGEELGSLEPVDEPASTAPGRSDGRLRAPLPLYPRSSSPGEQDAPTGVLVPLYTVPTDSSWTAVIGAKCRYPAVPITVVINPASGPGKAADPGYAAGIKRLTAGGIKVLGYVATGYGSRPIATAQAEIDSYLAWYPEIGGIFFDEQASATGFETYYRTLTTYVRSRGMTFTVGNPGLDTRPSYIGTVDLILIYESAGLPSVGSLDGWHASYDRRNFGIIPHSVPTLDAGFVREVRSRVGYLFITSDTLPNPWDSMPSYFETLIAELARTV